jgi:hypothetical protein
LGKSTSSIGSVEKKEAKERGLMMAFVPAGKDREVNPATGWVSGALLLVPEKEENAPGWVLDTKNGGADLDGRPRQCALLSMGHGAGRRE